MGGPIIAAIDIQSNDLSSGQSAAQFNTHSKETLNQLQTSLSANSIAWKVQKLW